MRWVTAVWIVVSISMGLWGSPAQSEDPDNSAGERTAPSVVIFTSGNWYLVADLKLKDGSVIYRKPGETARAIPDYKVDWTRTGEVNQALRELVEICRTDQADLGWVDLLEGRSARIFVAACNRTMPECLERVRDRSQKAGEAAREQERKDSVAGLEDATTSEALKHADDVVFNNTSITTTARHMDGVVYEKGGGHDHLGEYADQAATVINEQCRTLSAKDPSGFDDCVERQTGALGRLEGRTRGALPAGAFSGIRDHCRREWLRDYVKRDGCEVDEMAAFRAIERLMADSRYGSADLARIRDHCRRTWATSYTMQEVCIEESLDGLR